MTSRFQYLKKVRTVEYPTLGLSCAMTLLTTDMKKGNFDNYNCVSVVVEIAVSQFKRFHANSLGSI